MALSNTHGWLVLATGNKSEMAVGYATLYGDMVGGFALLKDVFKTDVFRLARHLNERAGRELIPVSTIERPPTRGAARGPARRPVASALRRARPRARGIRRARPLARGAARAVRSRRRRADPRPRRPGRVQAPSGGARGQAPPARVRPRLADADHEPLARLRPRQRCLARARHLARCATPSSAPPTPLTVRQFRTVMVVGMSRFVSASMSFERACPFGTLM